MAGDREAPISVAGVGASRVSGGCLPGFGRVYLGTGTCEALSGFQPVYRADPESNQETPGKVEYNIGLSG